MQCKNTPKKMMQESPAESARVDGNDARTRNRDILLCRERERERRCTYRIWRLWAIDGSDLRDGAEREEGAVSQMNRAGDVQAEPSPADITEWEK